MTQLNKAEVFALQVAQRDLAEAESRAVEMRARFADLVSACGLDPNSNYQLAPDGTVTPVEAPRPIEAVPAEDVALPEPVRIGKPG